MIALSPINNTSLQDTIANHDENQSMIDLTTQSPLLEIKKVLRLSAVILWYFHVVLCQII
jgi:hypothetical protein